MRQKSKSEGEEKSGRDGMKPLTAKMKRKELEMSLFGSRQVIEEGAVRGCAFV